MSSLSNVSYHLSDLLEALRVQVRVVSALIMREVRTRFGKHRIGYVWAIVDPCAHIATWFLIFVTMRQASPVHDMSALLFIASGIVPLFFFRRVSGFLKGAIRGNRGLQDYPQIKNVDFWIARFVLESWAITMVALMVFGVLIGVGAAGLPRDAAGCLGVCCMLLLLGFGFGAFNSVVVLLSPTYEMILGILGRVIYLTSGIFFLGDRIPPKMLTWISLNPVFHGIELFRSSYSFTYRSSSASPGYLLGWGLCLVLLALAAERAARARLALAKAGRLDQEEDSFEE
jgi:capsular polysaccharide transport system permease protein